ncbi:MAG: transposase [SAR324 cluster bacterium]|nr:transposase [SAR324 cluster bacterium]
MELFPALILLYLDQLSPCFSRYSVVLFEGYVWSSLITNGRKCMSRLASACWFVDRHLSSWERFLADHHWSITELTRRWFSLLVSRLLKLGVPLAELIFVLDTTLVAKVEGSMLGVQRWSAHPGENEAEKKIIGHHWAILGLAVRLKNRYVCFGLLSRLISGHLNPSQWIVDAQGHCRPANFWDAVHPLIWQTLSMTQQGITLVCDAYFAKSGFLNPIVLHNQQSSHRVNVITRMRWDAVCFSLLPPVRKQGQR